MRFRAAYSDDSFAPMDGARRYVYVMPGDCHLVVKAFKTPEGEKYTVKIWDNTLDYQRTVKSWRTKYEFVCNKNESAQYARVATGLLEKSGFVANAIVNKHWSE